MVPENRRGWSLQAILTGGGGSFNGMKKKGGVCIEKRYGSVNRAEKEKETVTVLPEGSIGRGKEGNASV